MHLAHYVAYPLYNDLMKSGNRTDDWQYDPSIQKSFQPNLLGDSYVGKYSRGHQLPSADRSASRELNRTTFYFSNMVPQNQTHNGGVWNALEEQVRKLSKTVDTLYVVTGVGFDDTNYQYTQDRSGVDCPIPDYFYKVVVWRDRQERWHSKAWCIPHKPLTGSPAPYQTTLSEMETKTGFDFFPRLNDVNVLND